MMQFMICYSFVKLAGVTDYEETSRRNYALRAMVC